VDLEGVQPPVHFRYAFPSLLAGPGSSGSADPSRRCQGCSHPPLRFQDRAALSFTGLLRQSGGGVLSSPLGSWCFAAHVIESTPVHSSVCAALRAETPPASRRGLATAGVTFRIDDAGVWKFSCHSGGADGWCSSAGKDSMSDRPTGRGPRAIWRGWAPLRGHSVALRAAPRRPCRHEGRAITRASLKGQRRGHRARQTCRHPCRHIRGPSPAPAIGRLPRSPRLPTQVPPGTPSHLAGCSRS
jgi:hypothetical protein